MGGCSVVVVSYYSGAMLFATLRRIFAQDGLEEVLLMDNGNAPDTLSRLQQMALSEPRLRIVTGHGNIGLAKACNLAAAQAKGEYLLFLQPDCLLPPQALAQAEQALLDDPKAAVAGCWLLNADGSEQHNTHALVTTPRDAFRYFLRFGRKMKPTQFIPGSPFAVAAAGSNFMFMRRQDFERFSGFDESFFLCLHDIDFCRRVQLAARSVVCVPGVQVVHMHESTATGNYGFIMRQYAWGMIRYFRKHFTGIVPMPVLWALYALLLVRAALFTGWSFFRVRGQRRRVHSPMEMRLRWLVSGLVDVPDSDELAGRRVLLTGATSAVGLCVLRRLMARGAQVAASHHCASCHTPALTGQEQMPRLAGQRIDYMVESLKAMRDNKRTSADPFMVETVVGLSDQDLAALAHYAASK